jgi:hypothetical protein
LRKPGSAPFLQRSIGSPHSSSRHEISRQAHISGGR